MGWWASYGGGGGGGVTVFNQADDLVTINTYTCVRPSRTVEVAPPKQQGSSSCQPSSYQQCSKLITTWKSVSSQSFTKSATLPQGQ